MASMYCSSAVILQDSLVPRNQAAAPPVSVCSLSGFATEQDPASPVRWSKEVLQAIDVHLFLLQQQSQHREPGEVSQSESEGGDGCVVHECVDTPSQPHQLVELLSCHGTSLPEGWEQHLDLRTGQVYYVHWNSCKRSKEDPRKVLWQANKRICEFMHRAREALGISYETTTIKEEEVIERSCSECITRLSMNSEMIEVEEGIEAQSKWTPHTHTTCALDLECDHLPSLQVTPSMQTGLEMEVISCHQCVSFFATNRANPWCPHCGYAIV